MIKLLLLLLSGAKLGKIAVSGGSMLLSLVVYASIFGWVYAAGLIAMIFIHEMGHYLAARQRGLEVGLPAFIPFVGAWVQLKDRLPNAETEAYVGIAGPAVGSAAAPTRRTACTWRSERAKASMSPPSSGCGPSIRGLPVSRTEACSPRPSTRRWAPCAGSCT